MKLSQIVEKYREAYRELVVQGEARGDFNAEINVAVSIYFCTYFHLQNLSCKRYLSKLFKSGNHDQDGLLAFIKAWEAHEKEL
jgi:hypothetical protein